MDADKIKNFVVYNFEKMIVAIVVLMSAYLVSTGLDKPVITDRHNPGDLATEATQVKSEVDLDHSPKIIPDRTPQFNIAQKQQEFRNPIPSDLYVPDAWDFSKVVANKVRRKDPVLGKPAGVQATGVIATLAYRSTNGLYALTDLEPADELEVIEQKPKRTSRRSRRDEMMTGGGMEDEMGGYGGGGDEFGMDDGMGMEMMMDMGPGGFAGADAAAGTVRKLAAEDNLGHSPKVTLSLRKDGAEEQPIPGLGYFIAGTAAIPHKELISSYQEALSNAADYNPTKRDLPLYIAYEVQRADVTTKSVDQLVDADWMLRDTNDVTIKNAALYWSGFAPEVVPADYWANGVTMWIPPVILDSYTSFSTNPLIPLRTQRDLDNERLTREAEERAKTTGPADEGDFVVDVGGGQSQNFGAGGGYGMEEEGYGMEDEGYGMEDEGYGGGMGMGMGGLPGMAGKPAEENPVGYKLIRFYDFFYIKGKTFGKDRSGKVRRDVDPNGPRPNRSYVYRVRFAVNDPNFPEMPELQPRGSTLDPDAYNRYISLSADAEQNEERTFRRWSDWSDPCDPTSLPKLDRSTFGPVKAGKSRIVNVGQRQVVLESEPPKAEVVASSFDSRLGVFVPTLIEATEGTVLSTKVESADVIDPITLEVKKTGEKIIKSSATVIDVEGGSPMDIVDDEDITEPGMFLMIDSEGNLKFKDTTDEQRTYRIQSFATERGL